MFNYTIKYRTFDSLMADVRVDFPNLDLENMIEPQQLIKVTKRVNYDLGLRVMMTKQAILDVERGKCKLPDDFYSLNLALICDEVTVTQGMPAGTNIQEVPYNGITPYQMTQSVIDPCTDGTVNCGCGLGNPCTCNSCNSCHQKPCCCPGEAPTMPACATNTDACVKPRLILNCKNECFELVQIVNTTTNTYKRILPIRIVDNPENVDCNCPNLYMNTGAKAWIQNGFLMTNLDCAKVYIQYQGAMEDDDGNLLVVDHDLINEYYEYAVKQRILENLIMNDEPVDKKLQLVEARLRVARIQAVSLVNTPNFSEMKQVWAMNRKAMNARYVDMFKSYSWYQGYYQNVNQRLNG
jgi:hypothetical protein